MLIFAHNYRFFFNVYDLINVNYQKRLIRFHGNCGKESFGFIDQMYKKHSIITNVKITNYQDFPSSSAFFFRLENLNNDDYLIVLNKNYLEFFKYFIFRQGCRQGYRLFRIIITCSFRDGQSHGQSRYY
jgi:uncharacterized protein (UPF0371 family)